MRRLLFALAVFALLAGTARGDVFVPADPPWAGEDCVVAAGDVVAAHASGRLQVSVGGGPFLPVEGVDGCPSLAAADDGTLAIVGSGQEPAQMVVGRPGAFSAPIPLDGLTDSPSLAVGRGGWTAAAWVTRGRRDAAVMLLVVAPDGRQTRTVLERRRSEFVFAPMVGIGPAGDVTVLWARPEPRSSRLRVARVSVGGAPVISDLPGVLGSSYSGPAYALAVAPSGATLLVWATEDGVRALEGRGEPILVSPSEDAASVTAAINDAGAALVAHGTTPGEVVLVDRAPGGLWAAPRVLGDIVTDPIASGIYDSPPIRGSVLAPDGRAIVVWANTRQGQLSVTAANGRAGGPWSGPATLSAITRDGVGPTVSLDARGEPRVLWSETGAGVRGARLAPTAPDTTPPVVSARLPARIRLAPSGRFRLAVPVRCSEACDARLSVRGTGVARALPAGRTTTLRFRAPAELGRELRLRPRSRRVRVRLLVTDRAGNVVRSSRVVRVSIG